MKSTILALLTFVALSIQATDKPLKPNILIIFTDDQGYADWIEEQKAYIEEEDDEDDWGDDDW